MAAQTWTTIQSALVAMLAQAPYPYNVIPNDFMTLYAQATSYAEQRIYRELVPINQRGLNTSLTTTAAKRTLNLSATSQNVVSVEAFGLIWPAGTTDPTLGTVIYFDAASLDVIDLIWPQESVAMDPSTADWIGRYWAMRDDQNLVFAPTANSVYTVALTGTFEPVPISFNNSVTYLSSIYPDLLIAACMVFLSGALLRNFGAQSDDPKMATSWETQYSKLMQSAQVEEARRRMQSVGWSQAAPSSVMRPDPRN